MSFRRYGGVNYSAKNNIIRSNYNTSANLSVTGDVGQYNSYINFLSDISGNVGIIGDLDVSGNEYISGNLDVSGNTNIGGNLYVYDNTVIGENLDVSGNTNIGGNLDVSGNANIGGNLDVSGNAHINGNLDISGNEYISGNLDVSGTSYLNGLVYAPAGITGSTGWFDNLYASNNLQVDGNTNLGNSSNDTINMFGTLGVTGPSNFNGLVSAPYGISGGTGTFDNLFVYNNTDVCGNLFGAYMYLTAVNQNYTVYPENSVVPKSYIDTVASGLKPGGSAVCATTASIGGSGDVNPSGIPPISSTDGYQVVEGDAVLVVCQNAGNDGNYPAPSFSSAIYNGLWIVSAGLWSRPALGTFSDGTNAGGGFSFIQNGLTHDNQALVEINNPSIVGLQQLQFTVLYQVTYTIGQGLNLRDNTLSVDPSLNFINYLDSTPGVLNASGTLTIGSYTSQTIIGATGPNASPVIIRPGITGTTGSFTNLYVSGTSNLNGNTRITSNSAGPTLQVVNTLTTNDSIQAAFTQSTNLVEGTILSSNGSITEIKMNNTGPAHFTIRNDGAFKINNTSNSYLPFTTGTNNLTILTNGNVGIGTTTPAAILDVLGNAIIGPVGVASTGQLEIYEAIGSGPYQQNSQGATPVLNADIQVSKYRGSLVINHNNTETTGGTSSIVFPNNSTLDYGGDFGYIQYFDHVNVGYPGSTGLQTGLLLIGVENNPSLDIGPDRISLYSCGGNGYVGVNTMYPQYSLDVNNCTRCFNNSQNGVALRIENATNMATPYFNGIFFVPYLSGGGYNGISRLGDVGMIFDTAAEGLGTGGLVIAPWVNGNVTTGLRIAANGNVAIGASSAVSPKLEIQQYIPVNPTGNFNYLKTGLFIHSQGDRNDGMCFYTQPNGTDYNNAIGVIQYVWDSDIAGSVLYRQLALNPNGGTVFINRFSTDVYVNTYALDITGICRATSFVSGSDYRLKTNIQPLLPSRTIDDLKPVEYDLSGNTHDMGFIAHEVQEVLPFLVYGEKDGENMQSLNYTGFIALLVKEVQDLKRDKKALEERLDRLEKMFLEK
jgi:hypothetical protein